MSANGKQVDAVQVTPEYFENQRKYPPEQLRPYEGQFIAWSLDGARILASGETLDDLEQKLLAAGIQPNRVLSTFVPPSAAVIL